MIKYDNVTKENVNKHNLNWAQISDDSYIVIIFRGSGSGKTNALFNLIKQKDDDYSVTDKIYFYVKDENEAKYQYLIE